MLGGWLSVVGCCVGWFVCVRGCLLNPFAFSNIFLDVFLPISFVLIAFQHSSLEWVGVSLLFHAVICWFVFAAVCVGAYTYMYIYIYSIVDVRGACQRPSV